MPQTDETRPEIDPDRNRFKTTEGYTFDVNGNVTVDFAGRQFTFNGDNKQTQVKDAANNVVGTYFYDGEGKRVKKVVGNETTIFVYSNGKLIAEYSTETPPANPTTQFTITDQLGSPRVILDSSGHVVSRRDFMPFGEEIEPDTTYRTTARKYGQTDDVRQKFTGYQKDEETGLDFAEARMYENRHGRFTAVDPLLASGKSADPQTFNRYVYVQNNPLVLADPSGLQAGTVVKGDVYYNSITDTYQIGGGIGFERYNEGTRRFINSNGRDIEMTNNGWTDFGQVRRMTTMDTTSGGALPVEYTNAMEQAFAGAASQVSTALYAAAPDYCKVSVSAPLFPVFEGSMTKDGNAFYGGGLSRGISDYKGFQDAAKSFNMLDGAPKDIGFKMSASFTCGYFTTSKMSEEDRTNAAGGTNFGGAMNLPILPAAHFGFSKSLPILGSPPALEVGVGPNTGGSLTTSTEFRPGGVRFSDYFLGRNRQQTAGDR